jgi:hypothetical protein
MVNISSLALNGPNAFGKQTQYFIANITGTNQLCFNEVRYLLPVYFGASWALAYGGFIDNISLIAGELIKIKFEAII